MGCCAPRLLLLVMIFPFFRSSSGAGSNHCTLEILDGPANVPGTYQLYLEDPCRIIFLAAAIQLELEPQGRD